MTHCNFKGEGGYSSPPMAETFPFNMIAISFCIIANKRLK